jgi:hypothetical protein
MRKEGMKIKMYILFFGMGVLWMTQSGFTSGGATMVGQGPRWVATADFNSDGKADLAVANRISDDISILLGNGTGGFTLRTLLATGRSPNSVTVADFSSDGIPDIAVTNRVSNTLSIFLGIGNGDFILFATHDVGDGPRTSEAADFNGDNIIDLAVSHRVSDDIIIYIGDGSGGFVQQDRFFSGDGSREAVAGDFNQDGIVDLAVAAKFENKVVTFTGNGDGTFILSDKTRVGQYPTSIATGDFNSDGILDLAAANLGSITDPLKTSRIAILAGDGNGKFIRVKKLKVGDGPRKVITADFNNDGILDLAVANERSDNVSVRLGDGNGGFNPPVNWGRGTGIGSGPQSLAAVDVNSDGLLDIVATNLCSDFISILINDFVFTNPITDPPDPDPNTFTHCIEGDIKRRY